MKLTCILLTLSVDNEDEDRMEASWKVPTDLVDRN